MQYPFVDEIASEALAVLGTGRQVEPFSSRYPNFDLASAYEVAARLHQARVTRGEKPIGRKIGFTNRAVWANYGISSPICSYVYDSTVKNLEDVNESFTLTGLAEPRIEPEIVLHLANAPRSEMSDDELLGCVDWVAHGFEIVHSIFPGWEFTAADAVAGHGVHAALLLGRRHSINADRSLWADALQRFAVKLQRQDGAERTGHGWDVLGGPVQALRFLVRELEQRQAVEPLAQGECVTTGTLTAAMPAVAGEAWTTMLDGIGLDGIRLQFR